MDTGWFNDLIRHSPYGSQRRLARKLRGRNGKTLDPSALSLMLRGKRAIQLHEARQFADLLDVPLIEVLRHAGIALPEEGLRSIPVIGTLDRNAELKLSSTKEVVAGPGDAPPDSVAVRCVTARSEHDLLDGWVFFAHKPDKLTDAAIGKYCLVAPKKGRPGVGFVQRGYRAGTANLLCGFFAGQLRQHENVAMEWVAPIFWVRPQQ